MTAQQAADLLAALETAYYSGALSVRHGDWSATYRTAAEMKSAMADLRAIIAGRRPSVVSVAVHGKGL